MDFNRIWILQNDIWLISEPQLKSSPRLLSVGLLVDSGHTRSSPLLTPDSLESSGETSAELAPGREEHDEPVPGGGARGRLRQVLECAVRQLLGAGLLHPHQGLQHYFFISGP